MRKKGFNKVESPEKMPVHTSGIQMSRTAPKAANERLTGGNAVADESGMAALVIDFLKKTGIKSS